MFEHDVPITFRRLLILFNFQSSPLPRLQTRQPHSRSTWSEHFHRPRFDRQPHFRNTSATNSVLVQPSVLPGATLFDIFVRAPTLAMPRRTYSDSNTLNDDLWRIIFETLCFFPLDVVTDTSFATLDQEMATLNYLQAHRQSLEDRLSVMCVFTSFFLLSHILTTNYLLGSFKSDFTTSLNRLHVTNTTFQFPDKLVALLIFLSHHKPRTPADFRFTTTLSRTMAFASFTTSCSISPTSKSSTFS